MNRQRGVIVFDIGGTWFRSAVRTPSGELAGRSRQPALSFRRHPERSVPDLQNDLVRYLAEEAQRLREQHDTGDTAVVSMGAALNAHTGLIFNSGPLWGPECQPLDLPAKLAQRAPSFSWHILNDVTAALLRHVRAFRERRDGRLALITISSGIACRVYDFARRSVPVDPKHGLQGEIGHLVARCSYEGKPLHLRCDCGEHDHLNAFLSGPGIEAVLRSLDRDSSVSPSMSEFAAALKSDDQFTLSVLDAVTRPLAEILAIMFTHDPELFRVLLVGGVSSALGDVLLEVLLLHLEDAGLYQVIEREPDFFRSRLQLGCDDDDSGLIGCGFFAEGLA